MALELQIEGMKQELADRKGDSEAESALEAMKEEDHRKG